MSKSQTSGRLSIYLNICAYSLYPSITTQKIKSTLEIPNLVFKEFGKCNTFLGSNNVSIENKRVSSKLYFDIIFYHQ